MREMVKRDESEEVDWGQTMQRLADQGKKFLFYCNYKGKSPKKEGNYLMCIFSRLLREQTIEGQKQ